MQPPAGYVPPAGAKKPAGGGGSKGNGVRLFIGGLPPEAEDSDLKEHFSKFGELTESQVIKDRATGKSRNFGFVGIADAAREEEILRQDHSIRNRRVTVRRHQDQNEREQDRGRGQDDSSTKVFVGRLDDKISSDDLRETFKRFGKVAEVFMATGKKFGFVTFDSNRSARAAMSAGTADVNGTQVVIKSAAPMKSDDKGGDQRDDRRDRRD